MQGAADGVGRSRQPRFALEVKPVLVDRHVRLRGMLGGAGHRIQAQQLRGDVGVPFAVHGPLHVDPVGILFARLSKQCEVPRLRRRPVGRATGQLDGVGAVAFDRPQAGAELLVRAAFRAVVHVVDETMVIDPLELADVRVGRQGHHDDRCRLEIDDGQEIAFAFRAGAHGQMGAAWRQGSVAESVIAKKMFGRRWRDSPLCDARLRKRKLACQQKECQSDQSVQENTRAFAGCRHILPCALGERLQCDRSRSGQLLFRRCGAFLRERKVRQRRATGDLSAACHWFTRNGCPAASQRPAPGPRR